MMRHFASRYFPSLPFFQSQVRVDIEIRLQELYVTSMNRVSCLLYFLRPGANKSTL